MVSHRLFRQRGLGMCTRWLTIFFVLTPLLFVDLPAHAYIGPGAGAGTIAVVLGILASIVMAFFAILWYPLKRLSKKRKAAREAKQPQEATAEEPGSSRSS